MRFILVMIVGALLASGARAESVVFPPTNKDECIEGEAELLSWHRSAKGTYCLSGQDVLRNALPICGEGQYVAREGGKFVCKSQQSIPTCGEDEFLSYESGSYICRGLSRPDCQPDEVLTADGTAFYCVKKSDAIPTCSAGQFLTYNGAAYQCATAAMQVPNCAQDEVLTGSGGQLMCVAAESALGGGGSFGVAVSVSPDSNYIAPSDGLIFVNVSADPGARQPILQLLIDGTALAYVRSQDSYVSGVPSIADNSLTYPVRKGQTVRLTTISPAAAVLMRFIPLQ
jgi:hypothetical protein